MVQWCNGGDLMHPATAIDVNDDATHQDGHTPPAKDEEVQGTSIPTEYPAPPLAYAAPLSKLQ